MFTEKDLYIGATFIREAGQQQKIIDIVTDGSNMLCEVEFSWYEFPETNPEKRLTDGRDILALLNAYPYYKK